MSSGTRQRVSWWETPADVRARVEEILGGPVVEARSQAGGFSPGSADRVVIADGRRAFVKIAGLAANPDAPAIHRREAALAARLPDWAPAPRFIGAVDMNEWVALVLEDVAGRHPHVPWQAAELDTVLHALRSMTLRAPPSDFPASGAPEAVEWLGRGWQRLAERDAGLPQLPAGLAEWTLERLGAFIDAAAQAPADVAGDRLVHLDVRVDNLLLAEGDRVVLVDWPWAVLGAPWLDALTLLINVRYFDDGYDVESVARSHLAFAGMDQAAATRVLIALAGFFIEASTQPAAPGIPTLRDFQRDQAVATLQWLRERIGQ